jgi:hypothetical protein
MASRCCDRWPASGLAQPGSTPRYRANAQSVSTVSNASGARCRVPANATSCAARLRGRGFAVRVTFRTAVPLNTRSARCSARVTFEASSIGQHFAGQLQRRNRPGLLAPRPARGPVGPCPPVAPVSPSGPPPYCPGRACPCAGAWVRSLSPAASAPALPAAPDRAALCWAWARPPVLPPCRPPRTRPRWAWPRPPLLPAEAVHRPTRPDHSFRSARRLVPEPSIARCWAWPRPPCSHLDRRPGL